MRGILHHLRNAWGSLILAIEKNGQRAAGTVGSD
jgi:hypothetical protein